MKKILVLIGLALASRTSFAAPIFSCSLPDGVTFTISEYGESNTPAYSISQTLLNRLIEQSSVSIPLIGDDNNSSGATVQRGEKFSFSVNVTNPDKSGGYLSIAPENGGYRLRLNQYQSGNPGQTPNYYFNPGECANDSI